jgi:hypothetical protein
MENLFSPIGELQTRLFFTTTPPIPNFFPPKPDLNMLRNLRDHECVLVHCEKGFRRLTLPPLAAIGEVAKWFSLWRQVM